MTVTLYYADGSSRHFPHVLAFGYGNSRGARCYTLTERNAKSTETGKEIFHKIKAESIAKYEIGDEPEMSNEQT